jgi:hypothetical protein
MRLLNMGVSIAVITHAVFTFIGLPNPSKWVMAAYSICGGCLICCLETQLKFVRTAIAINFGFLFHPMFRFVFYLILASVMLSFDDLFGKILAGALIGTACYNTFVLYKYPAYRKFRDEVAKEEDLRIEGKIRERVRKEAAVQMFSR